MTTVTTLEPYEDDRGNRIVYSGAPPTGRVSILFSGERNTLVVDDTARLERLLVRFDASDGTVRLGASNGRGLGLSVRVGQDATVTFGDGVSTTSFLVVSAVEGASVTIGDDVMFASGNQVRSDDGHPIFDVLTGQRVNPARDITVGAHVWVAREAVLLGGAHVGPGSVIGYRSLVTGRIPNNVVAAGNPARVVRRDIAWERPHLSLTAPSYKPDAWSVQRTEEHWALTVGQDEPRVTVRPRRPLWRRVVRRVRSAVRRH